MLGAVPLIVGTGHALEMLVEGLDDAALASNTGVDAKVAGKYQTLMGLEDGDRVGGG